MSAVSSGLTKDGPIGQPRANAFGSVQNLSHFGRWPRSG
jgi:hypothetical protein